MMTMIIPTTYDEWYHCITVICQQELNSLYIEERIKALNSSSDYMTQKFIQLYGEQQRIKTLTWFEQAKNKLKQ
ncbi:MAG: hypothetical protein ACRBHB_07455 [Arenicella sp.]